MKTVLLISMGLMLVVIIISATLIKNKARFFEPPGIAERLSVYLTQHTAATSGNHAFPELRTPVFKVAAADLHNVVTEVVIDLGWRIRQIDEENLVMSVVITTPLFRFSDDLVVQVKPGNSGGSVLAISSASRKGKADFAANAGHIQILMEQVRQRTGSGE